MAVKKFSVRQREERMVVVSKQIVRLSVAVAILQFCSAAENITNSSAVTAAEKTRDRVDELP